MTTTAPIPPITGTATVDVHSSFERSTGGGTINDAIRGGGGWVLLLDQFASTVAGRP